MIRRTQPSDAPQAPGSGSAAALTLGALGVVYGDIGTSPLYTLKEIFAPATQVALSEANVVGAVSTIVWALLLVVTFKYVYLVLRADNRGEGGVLALAKLASDGLKTHRFKPLLLALGLFGATLFYGDSLITPAISVLGAMEGLEIATPSLKPWVIPITLGVLVGLFLVQRRGTGSVGRVFGPLVLVWFLTLGVSGIAHIFAEPRILAALNPLEAFGFLQSRGAALLLPIGAVVLALTGAEALYADMGHFGRTPIQRAWIWLALPCLALNYAGQGALLIAQPDAIENPFYRLFPDALIWPALAIASCAAIIASQAVISGAYSMTQQAVQMGYLPRLALFHTSATASGQIYMPAVNTLLLLGVVAAVIGFGSSSALAGAYGIAVTMTMLITSILLLVVALRYWQWPKPITLALMGFFIGIDLLLVAACSLKVFDGGWFPLILGLALVLLMTTWQRGRQCLLASIRRNGESLPAFIEQLDVDSLQRAKRTAIYLVADPSTLPQALLHNLKHNQVLHELNLVTTVNIVSAPWVKNTDRVQLEALGKGFYSLTLRFGFMEQPDVPKALAGCAAQGLAIRLFECSYFLSRETIVPGGEFAPWRQKLFAAMNRNASGVVAYFNLPDNAVVELGTRVQL